MDILNLVIQSLLAAGCFGTVRNMYASKTSREVSVFHPLVVIAACAFAVFLLVDGGYVWSVLPAVLVLVANIMWFCLVVKYRKNTNGLSE